MLTTNCPSCGAKIDFRYEDVLIKCPACELRFTYDELMNNQVQNDEHEPKHEIKAQKQKSWKKSRNTLFTVMSILHFLGWTAVLTVTQGESDLLLALHCPFSKMFIAAWIMLIAGIPLICSKHPIDDDFDMSQGLPPDSGRYEKTTAVGLVLCILTFFAAKAVYGFIEMFQF